VYKVNDKGKSVVRVSALVCSVVCFGLTVARYNAVLGSNALFCCDWYSWSLDDLLRGSIHLLNFAFANSRHNLVNDNMIQTESFLYEMLHIREGVLEFCQESDFVSRSQVDDTISFLACEW